VFPAAMGPSSGDTTVFMRHLLLANDCLLWSVDPAYQTVIHK